MGLGWETNHSTVIFFKLHLYDLSFPPTMSLFISFDILKYLVAPSPTHLSQVLLASRVSRLPYSVVCFVFCPPNLLNPPTHTDTRVIGVGALCGWFDAFLADYVLAGLRSPYGI